MKHVFSIGLKIIGFTLLQLQFFTFGYSQKSTVERAIDEYQHIPDLGNGYYLNPIFPGNYGDPSIVRVRDEYYMAFSRQNGIMIFRSRDLVNWKPIVRHRLPKGFNTVWAIDIQYFNEMFHIYMPIRDYPGKVSGPFGNFVIRSAKPEGPWSDPINLEIPVPEGDYSGIDPGFIQTVEGEKYLYLNHGWAVRLNEDGTKAVTEPGVFYEGWLYPDDWIVECMCLESPKLFQKDGFYYMVSAQGGTSGPSTAHMSVVARARHPLGPWENSPYNPLTRTYSYEEKFWHQGHGTVFEAIDGTWWTVYHGRLNGYVEMGRPTLLMPVEWTIDGWPVIKNGLQPSELIPVPNGENVGHGLPLSDSFNSADPGEQWYFKNEDEELYQFGDGQLIITAHGENHKESTEIYQYAVNKSFEVSVQIEVASGLSAAGLKLGDSGIVTDGEKVYFAEGPMWRTSKNIYPLSTKKFIWLKIKNYRKDLSFYFSEDGMKWSKFKASMRDHDSYRISLFSYGDGEVIFKNFTYQGLEKF